VPRGRVELPTPAFSGPRSTGELPRHRTFSDFTGGEEKCQFASSGVQSCHRKKEVFVRRFAIAIAFSLMLAPLGIARNSAQKPAQLPRIRVATRLVQVGVIVRDKTGPVANLTKGDFVVLDRGKPQKISVFSVQSGSPAAQAAQSQSQAALQPLPPNTFSDLPQYAAPPRSITVVLLDNLNTLYGSVAQSKYEHSPYWLEDLALRNAKNHLIEFIRQLQPQDRVAIYGLRHSLYVLCDFTSDRNQLLDIVKNYDARSITNREVVEPGNTMIITGGHDNPMADILGQASGFENGASSRLAGAANEERGAETMAALQAIAAHVANIPGRKNLVWLTANLPFSGAEMARVLSPSDIAVYPIDARGLLAQSPMVLADIPGTADADDVSGASGHMDNMPAQSAQPIGIATMEKLADETGGQAFVNTNDLTGAIRKAVEDSAVTYTLGFYINSDAMDGKFHEIKVEVHPKGLSVRYPKGYFAFQDSAPTQNADQQMVETAVQSPIESSMIPLQATFERVNRPRPNSLNLVCRIDIQNIQFARSAGLRKGAIAIYVIGQNAAGKALHNWEKTYNLQFTDAQYSSLLQSGIPFRQSLQLRPDVTILRIVVEDITAAHTGSLIIPLSRIN
jgi:VWFA-related protein